MQVTETRLLPHPRQHVWDGLMDFATLSRTLPGIERLEPVDEETCELTVKMLVPSITGRYEGQVKIVERAPIDSYQLHGEARGRLGWVRGSTQFELADDPSGTMVTSHMSFQTGGALAGVGQRFMHGIAKSMLRDFFTAFDAELGRSEERPQNGAEPPMEPAIKETLMPAIKETLMPAGMMAPVGPYVHGVKVTGGSLVFVAGMGGVDKDLKTPTTFEGQCRLAYENIGLVLQEAGTDFDHVVKFTNYIVEGSLDQFPAMAAVRREFIPDERNYAASTLVVVKGLMFPQMLLEIDTVAVVP
jgi:carbon monoxide dehydrogenase subunit G/enamine deaminase RidA (YjgF/YER057c/UK114 family)